MQIDEILALAKQKEASDVHLSAGAPVTYRVHGDLEPMGDKLLPIDLESFARQMLSEDRWQRFMEAGEIDFSYSIPGVARFRVNAYRQRGSISIAARLIPQRIPTMEELGLPSVLKSLMNRPFGLVLVTGPTGSGKSTTLAAVLDGINQAQRKHIITLEDPIEYLHTHKLSIIDQREIGQDTSGFAPALRAALRQDPDILLVGEMRDLETIATAITASETGHLVFATLHTSDAVQTVERIIDVFPPEQQGQIRIQLAGVLAGVVSQRLHRTRDG
ncbi:MAG: PilT/PilU family type 4a pilus ATPase, partial [Alicyclobacillus mali]|uniref:type IV pilus twitching motility protein PilT n=1 Tax=Alicyclobacillus mali (ex Roth et al. 2021) TaxID=1123961 RepID=UPI0023EFA98D